MFELGRVSTVFDISDLVRCNSITFGILEMESYRCLSKIKMSQFTDVRSLYLTFNYELVDLLVEIVRTLHG